MDASGMVRARVRCIEKEEEMKQETMHHSGNTLNASFHQKSDVLSLVIIASATVYYVARMWPMRPVALATDTIPAGYGSLVLSTVALIVGVQIVLQAVLAMGAGDTPAPTEQERHAAWRAARNAYSVLTVGMLAVAGSVFLQELTPFCTANIVILAFALAEIVNYGSRLFYARPSATTDSE